LITIAIPNAPFDFGFAQLHCNIHILIATLMKTKHRDHHHVKEAPESESTAPQRGDKTREI
jgi:hypothetical protein